MDNKNEKTFADLFSSSTADDKSKEINFGNLSNVVSNESVKKESDLTFDNLFDKVDKNQNHVNELSEKKEDVGLNSLVENIFDSLKEDNVVEINESMKKDNDSSLTMNSLFHDIDSNVDKNISSNNSDIFEEKSSIFESDIDKNDNESEPLKSFSNEIEINVFDKNVLEKDTSVELGKDDLKTEDVDNSLEIGNPFFDNSNGKDDNSDSSDMITSLSENKVNGDIVLDDTSKVNDISIFDFNNSKDEKEKVIEEEKNLFLDSTEELNDNKKDDNPFFAGDKNDNVVNELFDQANIFLDKDSNREENNLFFQESDSSESLKEFEEKSDFWSEPTFDKKNEEENVKKSVSPFFQEESAVEENPLFLNKINLIENVENSTKINNIDMTKSKHFNVKIVKKKEPLLKFILGVLSYAIFIWLLLVGVALLVYVLDIKIRAAKGDYSSPTFNAYVVLTGSMLPEIQVYDVVVTKKIDASKLEEGDIITFASADTRFLNTIITHRIIKKNYDSKTKTYNFQTRGDNNNVADSALVPESNIYGKVILKIPKLGYLQEFLASDGGWIIVILIPCLTVIAYDIVKLSKGLKRKKYKNIKVQK